jgi:ubiquinone/menaquinone biosynthesis C-methylase UbiE
MHWSMSRPGLADERRRALADVSGDVLEIGFGSGLNLPHYPPQVRKITALDSNVGTLRLARHQLDQSPIEVEHLVLSSERLPMVDASFDSVVSTFTLCSIRDVAAALREVRRVLRPGGRYFFLEHGLNPEVKTARWQHRCTPLTRWLGAGCHLDRPIRQLVEVAGFQTVRCDEHELPSLGKLGGYLYRGVATM